MEPILDEHFRHEWVDQTTVHPIGLALIMVLGMATLCVRRRYALLPMIIMACFVATAQRVVVFSLDFDFLRVMILFCWVRILLHHEAEGFRWTWLDYTIIAWVFVRSAMFVAYRNGHSGSIVFMAGQSYDVLGMYFLIRILLRDWKDLEQFIKFAAMISIPIAVFFIVEKSTGRNVFSTFGGVPELTMERWGKLRCQGAFPHPIIAGCFWASLVPLFCAMWMKDRGGRICCVAGLAGAVCIILISTSTTSVAALLVAVVALCGFPIKGYMRWVRWGTLGCLLGLHLVMKAPVWQLIARIDLVGGSTGWHRYMLINQAINRFDVWWLAGTSSTAHWSVHSHSFDTTNQYVAELVMGGLFGLSLFVAIIVIAFREVGLAWRRYPGDKYKTFLVWAIGASLFVHCISFWAVGYFGQVILLWYLSLALCGNLAAARSCVGKYPALRETQLVNTKLRFSPSHRVITYPESG